MFSYFKVEAIACCSEVCFLSRCFIYFPAWMRSLAALSFHSVAARRKFILSSQKTQNLTENLRKSNALCLLKSRSCCTGRRSGPSHVCRSPPPPRARLLNTGAWFNVRCAPQNFLFVFL